MCIKSRKGHLPVIHIGCVSGVNCTVLFPRKKDVLAVTIECINVIGLIKKTTKLLNL